MNDKRAITTDDLHEAAELIGHDDDGVTLAECGADLDTIMRFADESVWSAYGENIPVHGPSLALGVTVGLATARKVFV